MGTWVNLDKDDETIKSRIIDKIEVITKNGSPAVVNRGKKLLLQLREK
jgi:hypothetical protein